MPDPARAGLVTDYNAGDRITDEAIERVVSRRSGKLESEQDARSLTEPFGSEIRTITS